MENIELFNRIRIQIECRFSGLPYAHRVLIGFLVSHADPMTGIVSGFTYNDLISLLTVDVAPGRKLTNPQKQTIRSYLRTIEFSCPNDFEVTSKDQCLVIRFLSIPAIYQDYFAKNKEYTDHNTVLRTEEYTDSDTAKTLENTDSNQVFESTQNTESYTDEYTESYTELKNHASVKNINILKTNITNKQLTTSSVIKNLIDPNFYPSDETILLATKQGLHKVTDSEEIAKFVSYNQQQGTRWADFNPVFLKWLEKSRAMEKSIKPNNTRKYHDEQYGSTKRRSLTFEELMRLVEEANPNAKAPCSDWDHGDVIDGEYGMAMEGNDAHIRPTLVKQTRYS